MPDVAHSGQRPPPPQREANARTARVLLSIAVVFFGGVIFAQYSGIAAVGIGVVGLGVFGFLIAATRGGGRK